MPRGVESGGINMKLIEKMADDYVRSDDAPGCCACLKDGVDCYKAGFRAAREMAAEFTDDDDTRIGDAVRQLGEREV